MNWKEYQEILANNKVPWTAKELVRLKSAAPEVRKDFVERYGFRGVLIVRFSGDGYGCGALDVEDRFACHACALRGNGCTTKEEIYDMYKHLVKTEGLGEMPTRRTK